MELTLISTRLKLLSFSTFLVLYIYFIIDCSMPVASHWLSFPEENPMPPTWNLKWYKAETCIGDTAWQIKMINGIISLVTCFFLKTVYVLLLLHKPFHLTYDGIYCFISTRNTFGSSFNLLLFMEVEIWRMYFPLLCVPCMKK